MSRILVTGGAGFIGSHLVTELVSAGHAVRVLDNFSTGHRRNLEAVFEDIELVEGDLRSYERVHRSVRGCEYVLHQGALPSVPRSVQDPLSSSEINVGGTLNVVLAARDEGVRRVVFASSSSVYGDRPGFPRREDMPVGPLAPYGVSKLAAEQYCVVATRVYDVETVCLRYFNIFGARQDPFSEYSAVIPRFIKALAAGEAPTIYGTGEQSRDFTHVGERGGREPARTRGARGGRPGAEPRVWGGALPQRPGRRALRSDGGGLRTGVRAGAEGGCPAVRGRHLGRPASARIRAQRGLPRRARPDGGVVHVAGRQGRVRRLIAARPGWPAG